MRQWARDWKRGKDWASWSMGNSRNDKWGRRLVGKGKSFLWGPRQGIGREREMGWDEMLQGGSRGRVREVIMFKSLNSGL